MTSEAGIDLPAAITRRVRKVNQERSPLEALTATGRTLYVEHAAVATMPRGEGAGGDIVFFEPDWDAYGGELSDEELVEEYKRHRLEPADPFSLCAFNEENPQFADMHPHATHWRDTDGMWCLLQFNRFNEEREAHLIHHGGKWQPVWCYAGRPIRETS